eukprot:GFUD01006278.1.p1 GENE.GFUD01006278.1~~GFUD01006278.1.p1  ORF type:complete len:1424 (+),score=191.28 GFUD01006278.1:322-4593(+)
MCEAGEGRGEEVRERSPLHEVGDRLDRDQLGFFDTEISDRDKFRVRVRRSGASAVAKGPLVGRHPLKANVGNIAPNVRVAGHPGQKEKTRYGTASSETSPLSSRKNSATNGQEKSPISSRRQSSNIQAPQRPSRLPVVSMYNPKQSLTTTPDIKQIRPQINPTSSRKVTPPCQDQDQIQMSPLTPTNKYMRRNSMSPTTTLVVKRGMSPTILGSKRSASPSRSTSKRTASPKRGDVSRRVPSPVFATRKRSPSVTRSRPPSPGGKGSRPPSPRGPIRRNPSPSQLDPDQAEALRKRLGKARKVKLYLLQQSGSNSFLVAGDSPDQKYKVNIGPQTCSCGKGPGCLHLLFIMLRVFKIPENDSRLTARELKEFEIEALFRSHEDRKKSRVLRSRQQSMENLDTENNMANKEDILEEDALCPICQDEMHDEEGLTSCSGCLNNLHHHCMSIWTERPGENVFCPLCRSSWVPVAKHNMEMRSPTSQSPSYQYYAPSPYTAPAVKQRMGLTPQTSQNSPCISLSNSSGYSTISRTSDTLHMIEQGGSPEDIPLPKAEPIPQQHWPFASTWITHFGRDLVACLLSRDWVKRETGLRRLAREVVKILQTGSGAQEYSERVDRSWKCCAEMLSTMIEDKVYKVYLAAVKTLRAVLNFLNCHDDVQLQQIKNQMRPLIQSILIKCADGNRRISEVSTDALYELCRGQEGEMALGKHAVCSLPHGLGGIEYLLHIVLEERDLHSVSWQWIMGRLVLLERIIQELPGEFSLENKNAHTNFNRLMMIIDFTFQNLGSSHANVSKISRKVFILAAKNTACDNTTFNQVWELIGALDPTLQIRIRKRLTSAIEEDDLGKNQSSSTTSSLDEKSRTPQEQDRSVFLEKFLNECSNQHTEFSQQNIINSTSMQKKKGWRPPLMRSTSHSPSRQLAASRSASQSPSRAFAKPQLKKSLCQSVFNVNQPNATKRPNYLPLNKPRILSRLAAKPKIHDLATEVLPKFDLSFLTESRGEHSQAEPWQDSISSLLSDDVKRNAIKKSKSLSKVQSSRNPSPIKTVSKPEPHPVRSPPAQKKWPAPSREGSMNRTPMSSPLMGRDKRSGSCKDAFDYEESLALAMALSKSIYLESPLPVIPRLSQKSSQDVLAHPHRDMMEDGQFKREYSEGVDWTKGTVLGTGAYSTCYQARDVETGTLMAAKQISFCRNSDEEQDKVEQLIREEVLLISKLQHPHVVRMYGAIQEGSHINVFVEWMPGGSISSLLDKHGVFTEAVSLRYLHQILLGLDYLHSNGILHRDLKGANLLVDTSGHHLRIADFGAAARMMSKSTVPGEFQGQLQGTIAFMAPEVLRGDSYGRSCDIWSIGCCIIEMATTKPPWGASDVSNHLALIFRIACAHEPPEVPQTLSPALRDLALRCLELDPNLRPSARELLLHPVFHELQ